MEVRRVLFVCTGNSARSLLAEALLRDRAGDSFESLSAGVEPSGIRPETIAVLEEAGIETGGLYSKGLEALAGEDFDYVIAVCAHAAANCPVVPTVGTRLNWAIDDPAAVDGTEEQRLDAFRHARDELAARIDEWLASLGR